MRERCQDILERLVQGVTGSVPPAERAAVIEHLATCARCRDEAADIEVTVARLREAGGFAVPPGFWPAFMADLADRVAIERMPVSMRIRRALATPRLAWGTAVITLVAVLAISTAIRLTPRQAAEPDPVLTNARGLVTETMTTTLPSLGEMIDIWRAGLSAAPDALPNATERRR